MKNTLSKRLLSSLLAVLMLMSVMVVGIVPAGAAVLKTKAEALQWLEAQNLKKIDVDGYPREQPYQCVDLIAAYMRYLGSGSLVGGNGSDYINKTLDSNWTRQNNYQPGDIAVFPATVSYYIDDYGRIVYTGHVGVILKVEGNRSWVLEQNVDNAFYCRKIWRNNSQFQCSLRPKWSDVGTNYEIVNQGVVKNSEINTSATIKLSTAPDRSMPNNWGFFLSTNKNTVANANMTDSYKSIRREVTTKQGYVTEWDVAANYGSDLAPGTTYYFKFWAKFGNDYKFSGVESFRTTNNAPKATKLTVDPSSAEIGIGVSPTVGWTVQENDPNWKSRSFSIELRDSNGNTIQQKDDISYRSSKSQFNFTFDPIMEAGEYKVFLTAKNNNRETQATPVGTIVVHPDVTVTYVDADPQSFVDWQAGDTTEPQSYVKSCTWGKAPEEPNFPSHDGYTFAGWDKELKSVTEDTTVTATYSRNSYTVNFVDEKGNTLNTQSVLYYDSAVAPSYQTSETGYVFTNWDKDFSHVTGNMTVKAVIDWYNNNYSVFTTITSAKRDSDNSGYDISITVTNNANTFTMGRAVIALKTDEGKLLTSTESSAFAVKAGKTRDLDVFVPYDNAAKKVYVYIVNDYKTMTPICTEVSRDIDMGLEWTSWSTEMPAEGTYTDLESRTEYRYKVKETTKSYSTSLPGWTQGTAELVPASSGTIDYISNWPSGFSKSHWIYSSYNKTPKTPSENSTQKTTVSTSTVGYLYWHWCRGTYTAGPIDRGIYYQYTSTFKQFHAFILGYKLTSGKASDGSNRYSNPSVCKDTYWWQDDTEVREVKRCTWTTYNKYYNYSRISDWSDWTTENVANPEAVETRTVYRYKPVDTNSVENNDGVSRTVSGNLGSQYAGQELTLYIYKVDEASDYSNEYIGQTTLSNDGSYSFTFKLREEPTVKTGDYTVALGLEGASSLIYLDPIKAPRKEYTVIYRDWDGTVLSTQTVYEGDDAVLPDESLYDNREGYHFTHWTTTNTNVKDDLEIFAEYEINKYTVVFVDWEARAVQIREYEYGSPLTPPAFEETDPGTQVVWDKIADGVTTVTQNMVVCTEYTPKVYDVVFRDFDGNIISEQNVTYGYAADIPELDTDEDRIFLDWEYNDESGDSLDSYIVTSKIDVCPRYVFTESCEPVTASVESGEYSETISVELTTPTENAVIYYTLDGSDPAGENGIKYTAPITVRDCAKLNCYCVALGKNDSSVSSYNYIVNTDMTVSDYMREDELSDYVQQDPVYYNVQAYPAYEFKNTVTVDTQADYDAYTADGWQPAQLDYGEWSDWQDEEITATDTRQVETQSVYDRTMYRYYRWTNNSTESLTKAIVSRKEFNELHFEEIYVSYILPSAQAQGGYCDYYFYKDTDNVFNYWLRADLESKCDLTDRTFEKDFYKTQYRYRDLTEPHFTYTDWSDWQDEPIVDDSTRMGFEIDTREYEYEVTEPSYKYSRWVYTQDGEVKYSNVAIEGINGEWEYVEIPQTQGKYSVVSTKPTTFKAPDGSIWYNQSSSTLTETRTKTQYRSRYETITLYKWDNTSFAMSVPQGETRESRDITVYTYTPVKHHFVTVIPTPITVSANGFPVDIIADGDKLTAEIYPEFYGYTPYKLYTDAECTKEWNLAIDTVTEDVTLYAVYTPVKFNVTFAYDDNSEIETQSVDYLGEATPPATVDLPEGYILLDWDSDAYKNVTGDMIIHARYILEDEYSTINISNDELSVLAGSKTSLTAETSVPGQDIIWASSDDSIATVDGGVVTGVSAGTVTITATIKDSGESDTCTVTVIGNPSIQLCLTTVSGLGYDSLGYLRGVKADSSTVDSVKPEFANPASKLRFYDIADAEISSDGLIGTGTTVKLVVEGEELDSKVFVVTGDMNGDGIINNRDVAMMNRYLVDKINPADYQILAVDVNGDGSVNNRDAAMLARYLVGKEVLAY